jgi:hypothetical protein
MFEIIKSVFPKEFYRNAAYWRAFTVAGVMVVLAVTQLFTFEDYPGLIADFQLPGGMFTAWTLAIFIPLIEIASLPYLLSMKIVPKFRLVSKWAVLAAGVIWTLISLWVAIRMGTSVESGIFGATLTTYSGWWMVIFSGLLLWSGWLVSRELPARK